MKKLLVLTTLLLALVTACGGGGDSKTYPESVKKNFMTSCTAGAGPTGQTTCNCAFDEIQKKYSLKEFTALEERIKKGETPTELISIITKCVTG